MTRVPMGSPITLAKAGGIGANPFSEAIQKRYGVEMFSQFHGAQMIADKYGFTRDDHDRFPLASHRKEAAAMNAGAFEAECAEERAVGTGGVRTGRYRWAPTTEKKTMTHKPSTTT